MWNQTQGTTSEIELDKGTIIPTTIIQESISTVFKQRLIFFLSFFAKLFVFSEGGLLSSFLLFLW